MQILSAIRELSTFATNTNKAKGTNIRCRWLHEEAQFANIQRTLQDSGGELISRSRDIPFAMLCDIVSSFFSSKLCRDHSKLAMHMVSNIQPMLEYDRTFLQALIRSLQPAPGFIDLTTADMPPPTHTSSMSASSPPALLSLSPETSPTEPPPSAHVIRAPKRLSHLIATARQESSGPSPTQIAALRESFIATTPSQQQRAFSVFEYAPYTVSPLPSTLQVAKAKRQRTVALIPKPGSIPANHATKYERHSAAFKHRHQ